MARIAELVPADSLAKYERDLTARGRRVLAMELPEESSPAFQAALGQLVGERLPRLTETHRTKVFAGRMRPAHVQLTAEQLAAQRRARPLAQRLGGQFLQGVAETMPSLESEPPRIRGVYEPEGRAEQAARMAGSTTMPVLLGAATGVGATVMGARAIMAGALAGGLPAAAMPGTARQRVARAVGYGATGGVGGKIAATVRPLRRVATESGLYGAAAPVLERATLAVQGDKWEPPTIQEVSQGVAINAAIGGAVSLATRRPAPGRQVPKNVEPVIENLRVPPEVAADPILARQTSQATAQLQQVIRGVKKPVRIQLGDRVIESAMLVPEQSRVIVGSEMPVRLNVVDVTTGRVFPIRYFGLRDFAESMVPPEPRGPIAEARESVRAEVAAGKIVPPDKITRIPRAESEAQQQRAAVLAQALSRRIAENPGDKRVRQWRRKLERLNKMTGRATEQTPATRKETLAPKEQDILARTTREGAVEPTPKPAQAATKAPASARPQPITHPQPHKAAAPAPASPPEGGAPSPGRGAPAPPAAAAPQRVRAPGMQFSDRVTAQRVADRLASSTPGSDPAVVEGKRGGFEIEVNPEPAQSRLKKFKPPAPASLTSEQRGVLKHAEKARSEVAGMRARGLTDDEIIEETKREQFASARAEGVQRTGGAPRVGTEERPTAPAAPVEAKPAPRARQSFEDAFDDAARQGRSVDDALAAAEEASGQKPPANFDAVGRHGTITRQAREAAGQEDMFGGAAMLGERSRPATPPERVASVPTGAGEAREVAPVAGESKPVTVRSQIIHRHEAFQQRETGAAELVQPQNIQALLSREGGFSLDEIRKRPLIVWRDVAGEIGPAGRSYVIDGHHRLELAQHQWAKREDGTWVKTGQADRDIPAVEIGGTLAQAKEQARVANLAGISNTYTEKARIARELREQGKSAKDVAAQLDNVSTAKVERMVAFSHLDRATREQYFPAGSEDALIPVGHGEALGALAKRHPKLMTPLVQGQFLRRALDEGMTPAALETEAKGWVDTMSLLSQETLNVSGVTGTKLLMTPKQFGDTVGRVLREIDSVANAVKARTKAIKAELDEALATDDRAAVAVFQKSVQKLQARLTRARDLWASVRPKLNAAIKAEAEGKGSFDAAIRGIKADVDAVLGSERKPPPGGGLSAFGVGEIHRWLAQAIERVRRKFPDALEPPEPPAPLNDDALSRVVSGLKKLRPRLGEQREVLRRERGQRFASAREVARETSGESGLYAELSRMRGEHTKVTSKLRLALSQADVDGLLDRAKHHPLLTQAESMRARLAFLDVLKGKVPQENELDLLQRVYGQEFVREVLNLRPLMARLADLGYEVWNLPKSLWATLDLSAPLRQGMPAGIRHPREFGAAFREMFRYFADEKYFNASQAEIAQRPTYSAMRDAKLALTDLGALINQREEQFISSLAERALSSLGKRLPGPAGAPVRTAEWLHKASARAYTGFLNRLRADVFDSLVRDGRRAGIKMEAGQLRNIAKLVNTMTGRGESALLSKHAGLANSIFFSPRLIASRINMLNPGYYARLDPFTRRRAIESMVAYSAAVTTVLTLTAMAGADVETDPRSADFAKVRVGNTRWDIFGGFQQYIRAAARIAQPPGRSNRLGEIGRFGETKLSPALSFTVDMLRGRTMIGEKVESAKAFGKLFVPLMVQDVYEASRQYGPALGPAVAAPAALGVGVQTYEPRSPKPRRPRRRTLEAY